MTNEEMAEKLRVAGWRVFTPKQSKQETKIEDHWREETARLVLHERIPLDDIAKLVRRTRKHVAKEIIWAAYFMKDRDPCAARLIELWKYDGVGAIGAIKQYLVQP